MAGAVELKTRTTPKKVMVNKEDNLHEKIASYVQHLSGIYEAKSPVWMEHSYAARTQDNSKGPRSILMCNPPPCPHCQSRDQCEDCEINVEQVEKQNELPIVCDSTPHLDGPITVDDAKSMVEDDENETDDWEQKIYGLAQNPAQRILAMEVLDIISSMRMWRLTDSSLNAASVHSRKLRRRLSNHWTDGSAAWLHAALNAYLPRPFIVAYNEMLSHLQKKIPKLLERLPASHIPRARNLIPPAPARAADSASLPTLLLAPSAKPRLDARWHNALAHYFKVQNIATPKIEPCSVTDWIGSMYSATKQALNSAPSSYVLAGVGPCGASLAVALAASSACKATSVVLISPAFQTLEGPRGNVSDAILRLSVPTLFVVPQNGMQCMLSDAEEIRSRMSCRAEVLAVGSADDLMRLNSQALRRAKATREMVEIAIAAEVHRFVTGEPIQQSIQITETPKLKDVRKPSRDLHPPEKRLRSSVDRRSSNSPPRKGENSTVPADSTSNSNWPVTELTANKIMDLPIVFADDSQPQPQLIQQQDQQQTLTTSYQQVQLQNKQQSQLQVVRTTTSDTSTTSSPASNPQQLRFKKVIVAKRPGGGGITLTGSRVLRSTQDHPMVLQPNQGKIRILPMRADLSPSQSKPKLIGLGGPIKVSSHKIVSSPSSIKIINRTSPGSKTSPGGSVTIGTPTSIKIVRTNK